MYKGLLSDPTWNEVKEHLAEDYKLLGYGDFSVCFVGDDTFVIKLHKNIDAAYVAYVQFCLRAKNAYKEQECLKHFPKIKSYAENGDHIVVVMERLFEHSTTQITHQYEEVELVKALTERPHVIASVAQEEARLKFMAMTGDYNPAYKPYKSIYAHASVLPSIEQAFEVILKDVYRRGWISDMNASNILFRNNEGVIEAVITDPFNCGLII